MSAPGGKDGGRLGLHSVAPIVNVPPYHCLRSLSMPWRTEGPRPERLVSSRLQPGQRPGAGHHGAHLARGGRSGEVGLGPGWGRSHRAWSDGTHCVFCMLFSIPFHPLPELSVHGLEGKEVTQPIKTRQPGGPQQAHMSARLQLPVVLSVLARSPGSGPQFPQPSPTTSLDGAAIQGPNLQHPEATGRHAIHTPIPQAPLLPSPGPSRAYTSTRKRGQPREEDSMPGSADKLSTTHVRRARATAGRWGHRGPASLAAPRRCLASQHACTLHLDETPRPARTPQ